MVARIRMRDAGGVSRTITRVRIRDETGTLRTIKRVRGRDASGTLRTYMDALAVVISPATADGYVAGTVTQDVTTGSVLASVTGGTAPYTYAWAQTGTPSPYTWTIGTAAAASTTFTATALPVGVVATQVFRVTVTDAAGTVVLWDVFATARNNNDLSGGGSGEGYAAGGGGGPGGVTNPPNVN